MPRHDWRDDDVMSRDRGYRDYDDRDRGAFFGNERSDSGSRRRRGSGWGGLLSDEGSGSRERSDYRNHRRYGADDDRSDIPRDETERLIASNKVEGTPVYDRNGDRMGSIHNFMVDKFRGRVRYAVLKCSSGFLGLDDRYYPLDWDQLTFDTGLGGYRVDMVQDDLEGRGSWDRNERWSERSPRSERSGYGRDRDFDRDRDYETSRMRDRDPDRSRMRDRW